MVMNKWMQTDKGFCFMGLKPATQDDLEELYDWVEYHSGSSELDPTILATSLKGRYHPGWAKGLKNRKEFGGKGSHTYQTKKVTSIKETGAVEFFKHDTTKKVYHLNPSGDYVYDILDYPRTRTSYHVDPDGSLIAGPRPGSRAEKKLGKGQYVWDSKKGFWKIKK